MISSLEAFVFAMPASLELKGRVTSFGKDEKRMRTVSLKGPGYIARIYSLSTSSLALSAAGGGSPHRVSEVCG